MSENFISSKKPNFFSRVGAAVKKVAFVFQGDFAVAAGFAALLFLLVSAWVVLEDFNYDLILVDSFAKLDFSCFAAILASASAVFFFRNKSNKFMHIGAVISGVVSFGLAALLIFSSDDLPPTDYWGFFLLLLMIFMFAIYSGEKKDESLIFVFSKFINSMIIAHIIFAGFCLIYFLLFECIFTDTEIEDVFLGISYTFSLSFIKHSF